MDINVWYTILSFVSVFPIKHRSVNTITNSIFILITRKLSNIFNKKYKLCLNSNINDDDLFSHKGSFSGYYHLNKFAIQNNWDRILYFLLYRKSTTWQLSLMELAHLFKRQDIVNEMIDLNPTILKSHHPICIYNMYLRNNDISTPELLYQLQQVMFSLSEATSCIG